MKSEDFKKLLSLFPVNYSTYSKTKLSREENRHTIMHDGNSASFNHYYHFSAGVTTRFYEKYQLNSVPFGAALTCLQARRFRARSKCIKKSQQERKRKAQIKNFELELKK